jgi:hypothetical protein
VTDRTRTILRWIATIWLASTIAGVVVALWLTQTEGGRETVARLIERIVDDEIPGSMSIGRIETFGTPTIVHKLQIRDPAGALVLEADRAAIDFDLSTVIEGKLSFNNAQVQGGRVFIAIAPNGRTTMEEALSKPAPVPDPDPHGGFHFAFRNIEVKGVHLMFKGSEDPSSAYRIRGIEGHLDILREDTVGVRLNMTKVSGQLQEKLAGMPVRLVSVTGWVHGAEKHVLNLHALAHVADAPLNAHIKYFDRDKKPVEIVLSKTNGLAAELTALMVYFASMTTDDLEVRLVDS